VWLGPHQPEHRMLASSSPSPAARRWTQSLLESIAAQDVFVTHIGYEQSRSWPRGPLLAVAAPGDGDVAGGAMRPVRFLNVPCLRWPSLNYAYGRAMREVLRAGPVDALFTYNIEQFYRDAVSLAISNRIPWFPIVLDWRRPQRWPLDIARASAKASGVIFVSSWAAESSGLRNSFFFEGGLHSRCLDDGVGDVREPFVLYSGTKSPEGGVDLLLDAWQHVRRTDARLVICGQGWNRRLARMARRDETIQDAGLVSERCLRDLTAAASVLVNPRPPSCRENRFNFPSKLLEYLSSGKPIVSTWTAGLANSYQDLLIVADPPTPHSLARAIERGLDLSPTQRLEQKARVAQVIREGGGWQSRAKVLLDWCSRCKHSSAANATDP